jgi:hypothetical protein
VTAFDVNSWTSAPSSLESPQFLQTVEPRTDADTNLAHVHTVPDPYYVTSALQETNGGKVIRFVHLPAQAIIRIYSASGVLVSVIQHDDPAGGGEETWNVRNRDSRVVASGVYFYHIETPDHRQRVGRFTVINTGS